MAEQQTREAEENGVSGCMSTVIPGWFSEINPMWPGGFLSESLNPFGFLLFVCVCGWWEFVGERRCIFFSF